MDYLPYLAVIMIGIHLLLCWECAKIAKKKGVKSTDAFLVAFFGSAVAGFLYIIAQLLPAVQEEVEVVD